MFSLLRGTERSLGLVAFKSDADDMKGGGAGMVTTSLVEYPSMEARLCNCSVPLECLLIGSSEWPLGDVIEGPVELGLLPVPTCDEETYERDSSRIGPASVMTGVWLDKFFC